MKDVLLTGAWGATYGFLLAFAVRFAFHVALRKEGKTLPVDERRTLATTEEGRLVLTEQEREALLRFALGVLVGTVLSVLGLGSLFLFWRRGVYALGVGQPYGVWVFWLFWRDLTAQPATRQRPWPSLAKAITLSLLYLLVGFYRSVDSLLGRKPPGR